LGEFRRGDTTQVVGGMQPLEFLNRSPIGSWVLILDKVWKC